MPEIEQSDFVQQKQHQWILNHKGYEVMVRKTGKSYEIVIRESADHDPSKENWDGALAATNRFYRDLRIAKERS